MCKYCDNYRKNDVAKHINDYGFYITFDEEKNQVDLYVQEIEGVCGISKMCGGIGEISCYVSLNKFDGFGADIY